MKLIECDVAWHVFPACFATVTRTSLYDIFDFCGHNGDGIAWPQLGDPDQRIGFHHQELFSYCLSVGYSVTPIGRGFYTTRDNVNTYVSFDADRLEKRFLQYMRNYFGVLTTDKGFRVWDGVKMLNPINNRSEEYIDQNIEMFFIVAKLI